MTKVFFFAIFLFFLAPFQASFLAHFDVFGVVPNLVLLFVAAYNLLESAGEKIGVVLAVLAGIYSDLFSFGSGFFGFYIVIFLFLSFLAKLFLRKYVRIPIFKKGESGY